MNKALAAKLKLNTHQNVLVKNVPDALSSLFDDEQLKASRGKKYDAVVLFAATQAELNKHITSALTALQNDALLWIAYPKKSGIIKTDLSRDYGWDALTEADYIPVSLVAVDQTWSALRFRKAGNVPRITRQPRAADRKTFTARIETPDDIKGGFVTIPFDCEKEYGSKGQIKVKAWFDGHSYRGVLANMGGNCHIIIVRQDIQKAIGKKPGDTITVELERDTEERVVEVPKALETLLARNAKARKFFDSLSYTNRKEYAVWISSAKKPETQQKRLTETIEKLTQGLKNPSAKS